ncbi:HAD-like protein [Trametes coccinea BRFM310]|uniref:HAD-like protein n=1 Tax=Trametes coccinea (strain BRFM310) TaxID=1353009 RepID=A0A1Y2IUA6_TRAC3|nr:HAD-like protein [Trametes coccinea BRFM310]
MSSENPFAKYKALVFDCYGTLIDWETGIYEHLRPLFEKSGKPSDRETVIKAYSSVEHDLEARFPTMRYTDLLAKVYTTLEARLQNKETPSDALRDDAPVTEPVVTSAPTSSGTQQVASASVGTSADALNEGSSPAEAFARSIPTWQPFPDTVHALAALSKRFKLVILSNIDRDTIAKTRRLLEGPDPAQPLFTFDAVYTAEEVGAYKPAPEMLTYALKHLKEDFGIEQEEVLMTAQSLMHDIIPAKARGLDTAWINRPNAVTGMGLDGSEAKYVFSTLGEMAEAVEKGKA